MNCVLARPCKRWRSACAALTRLPPDAAAAQYADQVRALDATLRALHGEPAAPAMPSAQLAPPLPAPRRLDGTALALGTSAGAAAGAAAGAKAGALIDLGTGGLTLGAGTALGALLGGTTAWVVRSLQKKDEGRQDLLQHAAEAACSHYLAIAHQQRMPLDAAPPLGRALARRGHGHGGRPRRGAGCRAAGRRKC